MLRHGPTDFNKKSGERIRSWMDVPLSSDGERIARDSARYFLDKPLDKVIASDLKRTRVTAELVALANFCDTQLTDTLRDWNVGELCGMLVQEVIPRLNALVDNPTEKAPGGESFSNYIKRFEGAFSKLLAYTLAHPDRPVVAITHSRNFGAAHAYLTGDKSIYKAAHSLPPGGIMAYQMTPSGWRETPVWPGDDTESPTQSELEEN